MLWKDSGNSDWEQPPVGTFAARCIQMIDIGTQTGEYQGKPTSNRQIIIAWELPTETMTEGVYVGQPFVVSRFYTASLHEKANLRKDLNNWRGKPFSEKELEGFDARQIIGKPCLLSLTLNEKGRVRVTSVVALPKGVTLPEQINPSLYFSLDEFDAEVFAQITEGRKKLICVSPEYQTIQRGRESGTSPTENAGVDSWASSPPANGRGGTLPGNVPHDEKFKWRSVINDYTVMSISGAISALPIPKMLYSELMDPKGKATREQLEQVAAWLKANGAMREAVQSPQSL